MIEDTGKYHFVGELNIKRGRLLNEQSQPKDDILNWFFLKDVTNHQWGFLYKIENPIAASYGKPFLIKLFVFFMEKVVGGFELNHTYEVMRGQEPIGTIKLISIIEQ